MLRVPVSLRAPLGLLSLLVVSVVAVPVNRTNPRINSLVFGRCASSAASLVSHSHHSPCTQLSPALLGRATHLRFSGGDATEARSVVRRGPATVLCPVPSPLVCPSPVDATRMWIGDASYVDNHVCPVFDSCLTLLSSSLPSHHCLPSLSPAVLCAAGAHAPMLRHAQSSPLLPARAASDAGHWRMGSVSTLFLFARLLCAPSPFLSRTVWVWCVDDHDYGVAHKPNPLPPPPAL
jgi:hypothetical protein